MMITPQSLVLWASVLAAISALGGALFKIHNWYLKQEKQDEEIAEIKLEIAGIKQEQGLICKGMLAALDGLEQLGCNHIVPTTKEELGEHLNNKAHE